MREDGVWLGVAGVALLTFLVLTWARWPMLTADSARELYVPFQVLHGAVVYRDFYYLYGPVAPWTLAGLLAVFGERLEVLFVAAGVQVAVVGALLYAVARQVLAPRPSAVVMALFLTHFALGRDLQGYIWPYAFAATFAVAFGLALLLALLRHAATGRRRWLLMAGAAWGLSLVTKLEYGVAATGLVGVYLGLGGRGAPGRLSFPHLAVLLGPAAGLAAAVVGAVLAQVEVATVLESVWPTRLMKLFNSHGTWMGTAVAWRANLAWLALDLAVLAAIAAAPRLWRAGVRGWGLAAVLPLLAAGAAVAASPPRLAHLLELGHRTWMSPSFLLAAGVGGVALVRMRGRPAEFRRHLAWALLAAYVWLVALRTLGMGLNDYTPYQAPVALILWVGLAVAWLPAWLGTPQPSRGRLALWLCLLLVLGARHGLDLTRTYGGPHEWVRGPVGGVLAPVAFARPFNAVLAGLKQQLRPGDQVVAAPMEASLYLMLGLDNPVKEDQLFYGYLTTPQEEADFIERLGRTRVRFVVLSSYGRGHREFGVAYMPNLAAWLAQRCRLVASHGDAIYQLRIYQTPGR